MSWTLLTNDDGVDSPALVPFAKALGNRGRVETVVPDRERSWVGKAITRFDGVTVESVERSGLPIITCSGYPADATQLGMHELFDSPPDLVVSGINVGRNHGAGFIASSGTVGAAIEAWTSGIRAIAFSTGGSPGGDYDQWKRHVHSSDAETEWAELADLCVGLVSDVERSGIFAVSGVVNVNLPFDATAASPVRVTSVAEVGYSALHRTDGGGRVTFAFDGSIREYGDLDGTDVEAARLGAVSITPLRLPTGAPTPDSVRAALERN